MFSEDKYYSVEPVYKKVTKEEFRKFIEDYPRRLERDVYRVCDPPLISYNDFEMADRWPYSVVAKTFAYEDKPGDYFYAPEEERLYSIMSNYEDVFNSRTGFKTSEHEEEEKEETSEWSKTFEIKEVVSFEIVMKNGEKIEVTPLSEIKEENKN